MFAHKIAFNINMCYTIKYQIITSPPEGLRGIVFTGLSVCLSVCLSLCVCVSGRYFGILFLGY